MLSVRISSEKVANGRIMKAPYNGKTTQEIIQENGKTTQETTKVQILEIISNNGNVTLNEIATNTMEAKS